ncbi:MAG: polysaccharide deacetylase family protein [Solirubrobacterales bacterium]|nr:polysaccharide deacetylase family protein [Solirubrobacterales bacterium]
MGGRVSLSLGVAGLAVAWSGAAAAPLVPPLASGLRIPRRLPMAADVALTFDDGPHPQGTPAMLEILRDHGALATFFLMGEQVRRAATLRDEILAAGHAIAVHGDRHRNLLRLSPRAVRTDLDRAAATIGDACLPVHRAPYGIYTPAALVEVRRRGWTPLLWSRWGRDWQARATPRSVTAHVTRALRAGDVLLLHDADDYSAPGSWRTTVRALPHVLDAIGAAGLQTAVVRPATAR